MNQQVDTSRKTKDNSATSRLDFNRDEATLAGGESREAQENRQGFADEAEPTWAPPESQPEPRPVEPVLNPTSSNPSTSTNSPT